VLHPQAGKKRRHRDGYADNDTGLLAQPSMTASEFLRSKDPTQILAERSKIVFEDDAIGNHVLTDQEVRACGEDLRVLSKGDFRSLLKWRDKLLKEGLVAESSDDDESAASSSSEVRTCVEIKFRAPNAIDAMLSQ
jgi:AdoMet-dependent rRNA methyltransferase SPB1